MSTLEACPDDVLRLIRDALPISDARTHLALAGTSRRLRALFAEDEPFWRLVCLSVLVVRPALLPAPSSHQSWQKCASRWANHGLICKLCEEVAKTGYYLDDFEQEMILGKLEKAVPAAPSTRPSFISRIFTPSNISTTNTQLRVNGILADLRIGGWDISRAAIHYGPPSDDEDAYDEWSDDFEPLGADDSGFPSISQMVARADRKRDEWLMNGGDEEDEYWPLAEHPMVSLSTATFPPVNEVILRVGYMWTKVSNPEGVTVLDVLLSLQVLVNRTVKKPEEVEVMRRAGYLHPVPVGENRRMLLAYCKYEGFKQPERGTVNLRLSGLSAMGECSPEDYLIANKIMDHQP